MSSTFADSDFEDTLDRQLTLGTASLLGIFFGLVMVCGIFFGFGYSLGRRSFGPALATNQRPAVASEPVRVTAQPTPAPARNAIALPVLPPLLEASNAEASDTPMLTPVTPKPMNLPARSFGAVSSAPLTRLTPHAESSAVAKGNSFAPLTASPNTSTMPQVALAKPSAIHPVFVPSTATSNAHTSSPNALRSSSSPYIYTPPFYVHSRSLSVPHVAVVVQIAALSRQDDAEVLASSLRKRGYATSIHNEADDSLYHVQVGPYQRNVAMAARQRLIAYGYNAILK